MTRIDLLLLLLCVLFAVPSGALCQATGEPGSEGSSQQEDLDAELLEDLGSDLFGEDLAEPVGEDIGESSTANDPASPLEQIEARMRSAQQLLVEQDGSGSASRLQTQILQDLDELIQEVQRRNRQSQQGGNSAPGSQRSGAEPQGGQSSQPGGEGMEPAADSSDQLRPGASGGAAAKDLQAARSEFLKNLWGHLPQRAREQMLQSQDDEFLPKYELEIEQYFRRLAEDPDLNGR